MLNYKNIILLSLVLLSLVACIKIPTKKKQLDCPLPPKQNCVPGVWRGTPVDTSLNFRELSDEWYVFERVSQLNSPSDEWFLSFIDHNSAILTFSDKDRQRMMIVGMIIPNKAQVKSGIGLPLSGSVGGASVAGKKVIFAAREDRIIPADGTYNGSENKVNLEEGKVSTSDLYEAILDGNFLNAVNKLGENIHYNDFSWESHPSLSKNGDVLFYASNRPYYHKGTEIWFSINLEDGSWSEPINCGEKINSDCDELTPFITKDGSRLYFSSSGHETVGGYDIFVSDISPEFWEYVEQKDIKSLKNNGLLFSEARNLRPPLNTVHDEIFPGTGVDPDSILYYSSNQDKEESMIQMKGGFDIYVRKKVTAGKIEEIALRDDSIEINIQVEEPKDLIKMEDPEVTINRYFELQGTVYDRETKSPVPNADITVRQLDTIENEDPEQMKMKASRKGEYNLWLKKGEEYEVTAETNEYFYDNYRIKINKNDTTSLIKKDLYLPEMFQLRINFPTDVYDDPYRFVLDSNGVETSIQWQEAIRKLAKNIMKYEKKIVKVLLVGHTDDVGTESYNQRLGKNRVNFVIQKLTDYGVPANILEGRSAGEMEPLTRRTGESMEMFRKRLRRVTLKKVIKEN